LTIISSPTHKIQGELHYPK